MQIHVVERGQTLTSIARQYQIAPGLIARYNGLRPPYDLAVGQSLLILTPSSTYLVQEGDTLSSIAQKTGVSVLDLLRANPNLGGTAQLYPGQVLVLGFTDEPLRAVEEREGGYGNVGEAGGIVYFNDEYGNVYAVDTATGTRELFEIADGFLLSPDGSRMLQIVYEDGENGSLATMYLCDLASGTRMQIAAQAALSDYAWSEDSRVLFYLVSNRDAEDAEDYPVRLMRYSTVDGRTTDLGALASNSIFPGRTQDSILLMYYQDRDGLFYPITYQLSLTDLTDHAQDELVPTLE